MIGAFIGGAALGAGYDIISNLTGRPLELWTRTVQAEQEPTIRRSGYNANGEEPNLLPGIDSVVAAYRRGLILPQMASAALRMNGAYLLPAGIDAPESIPPHVRRALNHLWNGVSLLQQDRPSAGQIVDAYQRGRITEEEFHLLSTHLDFDLRRYKIMTQAGYQSPGAQELWQLWRRGVIGPDSYNTWMRRLGWTNREALDLAQKASLLPTLPDALVWYFRSARDQQSEEQFNRYMSASGWADPEALSMAMRAMQPIPGPSDLVRFAVREVWDTATVRRWGYDDEFPEPFHAWMRWHGMDAANTVQDRNGRDLPNVPWPLAYWRAHWQIMSPQQAYRALHLLRPDRLQRYQAISPGVQAFTVQDMATVLKVSDYPPRMRAWLQAIAFQPLRLVDIRSGFQAGIRDRAWAVNQLLDRGLVREDADFAVDLWASADQIALRKAREAIQRSVYRETITEVRAAYRMGGMDTQTATARLTMLGFTLPQANRVLALEDAKGARQRLEVFLRQMRRSYLTGALSDQEVQASLASANIAGQAIQQYLRLWQSELGVERRSLSTAQIVQAVASGMLPPAIAAVRMTRLGWTEPDAALLLQEAVAKLTRAQASAARQASNTAARQAANLQKAQSQARQAQLSAQRQLRQIYPLATLKRQFCLGIRKGTTISALLLSQGYTPDSISALLKQWVIECEESPPAAEKVAVAGAAYARRQTPISTIKAWWQNGVVTDQWARARLAAIGVEPGAIQATISLWQGTLGKKSGPATQATPQTQPTL